MAQHGRNGQMMLWTCDVVLTQNPFLFPKTNLAVPEGPQLQGSTAHSSEKVHVEQEQYEAAEKEDVPVIHSSKAAPCQSSSVSSPDAPSRDEGLAGHAALLSPYPISGAS